MQRSCYAAVSLCLAAVLLLGAGSFCAAGEFSAAQMKKMGVFLSNFTELGLCDIDSRDFLDPQHPERMIRFGIWHNYVNNYKSRIRACAVRGCPWGGLTLDGAYVTESIRRYFGYMFTAHGDVQNDHIRCHYDGTRYHFDGADGEAVYHVRVKEAETGADGLVHMRGELYLLDDASQSGGVCTAAAQPAEWKGKPSWTLVRLECSRR